MILAHRESLTENIIKINWTEEIEDWFNPLFSLLDSDYIDDLVSFIDQKYKSGVEVFPKRKKLFKPFKNCQYDKLKLVIITNAPPIDSLASGLGVGLEWTKEDELTDILSSIQDNLKENIYSSVTGKLNFDASLQDWSEQGILLLNKSMTIDKTEDHSLIWKNFLREVIKTINKKKENIIFFFMDSKDSEFKNYIDLTKHYVFENGENEISLNNPIFSKIDDLIEEKHGKWDYIQW